LTLLLAAGFFRSRAADLLLADTLVATDTGLFVLTAQLLAGLFDLAGFFVDRFATFFLLGLLLVAVNALVLLSDATA